MVLSIILVSNVLLYFPILWPSGTHTRLIWKSSSENIWLFRLHESLTCLLRKSLQEATTHCGHDIAFKIPVNRSRHLFVWVLLMQPSPEARRWSAFLLWFLPAWWFYNPLHLVIHPNKASLLEPMVSSQLTRIKYKNSTGKNCWWVRQTGLQATLKASYYVSSSNFLSVVLESPSIRVISSTTLAKK